MQKMLWLSIVISSLVLWAVSCGGGGGSTGPSTSTPTAPSPSPAPSANTTINIVGSSGPGAFNPNPAQVPAGGRILWQNSTSDSHVLVMNDGSPIGSLGPRASLTTTLSGSGGNFHCVTHPSMVGSINGSTAPPPSPPSDDYGY